MPSINSKPLKKYKLQWKIIDYDLFTTEVPLSIYSPIFCFKTVQKTSWKLALVYDGVPKDIYHIEIYRLKNKQQYKYDIEKVIAQVTLSFMGKNGIYLRKCAEEHCFEISQRYIFANLINRTSILEQLVKGALIVIFEFKLSPKMYHESINCTTDCEMFSQDMKKLYETKLYSDMILHANDKPLQCHRAILKARWPSIFHRRNIDLSSQAIIVLPLPSSTLSAMLKYLYIGKINMEELPVGFYQDAIRYNLKDVVFKSESLPDDIICETGFKSSNSIIEFSLNQICFSSFPIKRVVTVDGLDKDMLLRINIYNCSEDTYLSVDIQLQNVYPDSPIRLNCKIMIFLDNEPFTSNEQNHVFVYGIPWQFPLGIALSDVSCCIRLGKDVKLVIASKFIYNYYTKIISTYIEVPTRAQTVDTLALSADICTLLGNRTNYDIEISCGEHSFYTHKSILSCRSQKLQDMIEHVSSDRNIIYIRDIEPHILNLLLKYIYGTILEDETIMLNITQLYAAALNYQISSLRQKCEWILSTYLSLLHEL